VRHASASHVRIELVEENDVVSGTVTDDGLGFEPVDGHTGFGLISMAERATLVGGNVDVESSPDGTTIRFTLPVSLRQEAPPVDGG
jgi:signal transduction histidine kinase